MRGFRVALIGTTVIIGLEAASQPFVVHEPVLLLGLRNDTPLDLPEIHEESLTGAFGTTTAAAAGGGSSQTASATIHVEGNVWADATVLLAAATPGVTPPATPP